MATAAPSSGLPPKPPPDANMNNNNSVGPGLPLKPNGGASTRTRSNSLNAPPLPPPQAPQRRLSGNSTTSQDSSSRLELRKSLSKRQVLLTPSEHKFLEHIVVHGTEEEVEIAHENLMDENIFGKTTHEAAEDQQIANAWLSGGPQQSGSTTTGTHAENSASFVSSLSNSSSTKPPPPPPPRKLGSVNSSRSISSTVTNPSPLEDGVMGLSLRSIPSRDGGESVGSERRQELLQQRLDQNQVFDQIWQAHESGLAVTKNASRRSIRSNSFRFSAVNGSKQRSSQIFRRSVVAESQQRARSSSITKPQQQGRSASFTSPMAALMNDNKSDNLRRRPIVPLDGSGANESTGGGMPSSLRGVGGAMKPSLRRMASESPSTRTKPVLQRMMSDVSRKSVTFDVPQQPNQRSSMRSSSSGGPRRSFQRGSSFGSIPSIHIAHPIRSNSITSLGSQRSGMSYPAIPHSLAIRSQSIVSTESFPAIPHAVTLRSQSVVSVEGRDPSEAGGSAREEKKIEDLWPRVPSVVQTDNTAKYFRQQQRVLQSQDDPLANDGASSEFFQVDSNENVDEDNNSASEVLVPSESTPSRPGGFRRPVLMRDVSVGEGVEVADLAEVVLTTPQHMSPKNGQGGDFDFAFEEDDSAYIQMASSFDETMSFQRMNSIFRRPIKRSMSDEAAAGLFMGGINFLRDSTTGSNKDHYPSDGDSWQMDDEEDDEMMDYYDPWMVIQDEYENGYGGGGTLPFQIIGTYGDDKSCQPHVLSPPLMESLQQFFPFAKTGENFWLRYSLVRDGASMHTFLKHARNAKSSILAIETTDGEVFGSFTSECWRKNWNYFGTGEAFLWRMRHSRGEKARSIIDQAHRESEIDVFPYTGENNCIQLCTPDRLAVGGGTANTGGEKEEKLDAVYDIAPPPNDDTYKDHEWGFGLSIQAETMLQGTSSPCLTFGSPSLSQKHSDGSLFEIINVELWNLTPCYSLEEAEKLELGKLFLEKSYPRH